MSEAGHGTGGISEKDLAILAHEVRGALTVIAGFSELLSRPLSESDRARALDGIRHATQRIDRLLGSALSGSPDGAGEAVDVAALAERVVGEQRAASGRDIVFEHAEKVALVSGNSDALERALANLVDNALKYAPSGSEVEVRVGIEDGRVLLQVLDRGPGVSAADAERIFEPFERLSPDEAPGTGLGLTVVKGVAASHGGEASVSQRPGGGSVFTIALPVPGLGRPDPA